MPVHGWLTIGGQRLLDVMRCLRVGAETVVSVQDCAAELRWMRYWCASAIVYNN